FPDFAGPDFVKEAAIAAIRADQNQYAVSHGEPALRKAIAATWTPQLDREIDPDGEVTVTTGATEAIYAALQAFLGPEDELLAFEPFYDSYPAATLLAGATFVPVRLHAPDWPLPQEALESAVTPRTKALLLNTPHNPTGKVFTQAELEWVAAFAKRHDLLVITDEVYDRIVFGGAVHRSLAAIDGMWDRTLTIGSTGKTFSLTGWKIGYTIGPAALNRAVRVVHQFMTFATSTPFQMAMAHALTVAGTNGYYEELSAAYERRRQLLTDILGAAGLTPMPVSGSYFLMSDVAKFGFDSDVEFCTWLIREAGVVAIPPSAFYMDPATAPLHARFCFAKSEDTLEEAGRRLVGIANG
ncbi:MAG: aminotransferase class I/II-fold pyridoxal phosphate-dependent enzyme, partial [Thermomicrobiales bacterium]|nr:aminotransferase class I/II-fold pyridoxal phosphate-dependent enzyme [Thermomicrobiales bacterium]